MKSRRNSFNPDADDSAPAPTGPTVRGHPCWAQGCPMPGTIFTGGSASGVCGWHYGVPGNDVPRVTQMLRNWDCVSTAINRARRDLTDPDIAAKPGILKERFENLWRELSPLVPGWEGSLQPRAHESYDEWRISAEKFLAMRIAEDLRGGSRG